MAISKSFETFKNGKHHELQFKLNSHDVSDFSYEDIEANLFIDGKFIAEISGLLDKMDAFMHVVDEINWEELRSESLSN